MKKTVAFALIIFGLFAVGVGIGLAWKQPGPALLITGYVVGFASALIPLIIGTMFWLWHQRRNQPMSNNGGYHHPPPPVFFIGGQQPGTPGLYPPYNNGEPQALGQGPRKFNIIGGENNDDD